MVLGAMEKRVGVDRSRGNMSEAGVTAEREAGGVIREVARNNGKPVIPAGLEQTVSNGHLLEPLVHELFLHNRVREIAIHIPWYGFKTQARIALDSGVSPAAVSRLIRGQSLPSLAVALRVVAALSKRLNRPLDVSDVFSLDGTYPTPSACDLTGCRNCLPPEAYDPDENLRPEYRQVNAGGWSLSGERKGGE